MLDTLKRVRTRISSRENWTTEEFARDVNGHVVSIWAHQACSFCLLGAIKRECGRDEELAWEIQLFLKKYVPQPCLLWEYNDRHSHGDVLNLLSIAIHDLEAGHVRGTQAGSTEI